MGNAESWYDGALLAEEILGLETRTPSHTPAEPPKTPPEVQEAASYTERVNDAVTVAWAEHDPKATVPGSEAYDTLRTSYLDLRKQFCNCTRAKLLKCECIMLLRMFFPANPIPKRLSARQSAAEWNAKLKQAFSSVESFRMSTLLDAARECALAFPAYAYR
jgi:hypothetical protein